MEVSSETKASIEAMYGIINDDNDGNDNTNAGSSTNQNKSGTEKTESAKNPLDIIPQLEEDGITYGDLEITVKVLNAVSNLIPTKKNKKRKHKQTKEEAAKEEEIAFEKYQHTNLRPLRKAIAQCMNIHQRRMFAGKSEDQYYDEKNKARSLKRQKMAEREMQRKYIADTALRRGRIERLKQKQSEAKDEEIAKLQQRMMIPDGHVETHNHAPKLLMPASKEIDTNNNNESTEAPKNGNGEKGIETIVESVTDMIDEPTVLPKLRSCYACKVRYRVLHQFYDQLCPDCAKLNWEKRHQTANLKGKVAVVTGSRVKIGFQTCLKLLRAGATVVATTRFPNSAAEAYQSEPDFDQFKDRLQIYGLDLRDVTGIEAFCRFLKLTYSECGIDMLINNACQTIRRPTGYYLPMCQKEESLWKGADTTHKKLLSGCMEFERIRRQLHLGSGNNRSHGSMGAPAATILGSDPSPAVSMEVETPNNDQQGSTPSTTLVVQKNANSSSANTMTTMGSSAPFESNGISHSAAMSQMILLPEDVGVSDEVLPPGVTDINGQQLDLRSTNSWRLKMEEVSTPEVMECMFINAIAPFVLNSRLKPLMKVPHSREDRFIINVSAMEGKFYRYKMANHPHTNMAKAALNMMTRTSAEDLAKNNRIFMNSVDTGWINDENPLERATKTAAANLFQTPIDEIDAAARILDPIFSGINDPKAPKDYGKFLKDYKETEW
ncbi:unnamed protein product [Cylindrotheca closterium]|uniref:Oxidoreductase n=1 Tax=Cylindrotheca closterium TaxID=2856 RepID=A0AAD2FUN0_9STRA|nr:unnamed protein product [Cylindrotheca closterium]